uniref:PIR2-like helical domain-containing protein n=1 Tax=Oryza brachyantha TaxID=4533 RepID=J3LIV4_ORYBR
MDKEAVLAHVTGDVARWSLNGLLAFILVHRRYLGKPKALHYLHLVKADLAVALCLVEIDRMIPSSGSCSGSATLTTNAKVALKCAAIASKHPCPASLTNTWLSMASH